MGANNSKEFTVRSDKPNHIVLAVLGAEHDLDLVSAHQLLGSLKEAINKASLICDDCGVKDDTVEASGCPDAIKRGAGKAATLCQDCFELRDQWSSEQELPKSHCQNGRADICLVGAVDGICCAENECDIDLEFRSFPSKIN